VKKAMTMTLTSKRQTVFPLEWCQREGLEAGGPLNVFDLGKDGLLIRPVKAPGQQAIAKLLKQIPVGNHSRLQAAAIVQKALRQARDEAGRH
jgi:bifunctional DNA-binding transcriptional regulator/antitoxin component of YhaV-PrlF toxin-antitoxin module